MDKDMSFIDRKEENIAGNEPVQITPKKKRKNKKQNIPTTPTNTGTTPSGSSSGSTSEPPRTPGRERTELNIEIKGYKQTGLTPKSKVTSDKVRTIFRSSSGSTGSSCSSDHSSKESSPAVHHHNPPGSLAITEDEENEDVFSNDASHRTPTEVIDGGVWYLHRKTSESHYISQQYDLDASTDSPSKSVTAIPHVTFKSRKAVSIGSRTSSSSTSSFDGAEQSQSPQHKPADNNNSPGFTDSPSASSATNQFLFDTLDPTTLSDGKLDSDREDIQQIIQSSYLVSDISDVIDNDEMKAKKTSAPPLLSSPVDAWDKSRTKEDQKPSKLTLDPKSHGSSASRSTYSPGLAIRSYALEELAEKKSTQSPDAKSMRYDAISSKVDIDNGSSVDTILPKSKPKSTESSSPFKITRVNKVHLPDHNTPVSSVPVESGTSLLLTEEEQRESEDRLDNLVDITACYRFHDVGMMTPMMDSGGICNPAFDETDDDYNSSTNVKPEKSYSSTENVSPTKSIQQEIVIPVLSSSTSSALSSSPSVIQSPTKYQDSPNMERNIKDDKISQQIPPSGSENNNVINDVGFLLKTPSTQQPTTKKPKPDPVPFTRKFNTTKKFETSLKSLGATLVSESLTVDVYYDTAGFDLTLNDCWLRTRNGKWQFHSGFTTLFQNGHKDTSSIDNAANDQHESGVKAATGKKEGNNKKNKNKRNKNKNSTNNPANKPNTNTPTTTTTTSSKSDEAYLEIEDIDSVISHIHSIMSGIGAGENALPKDFLKKHKFSSVAAFAHRSGLREYVRYTSTHKTYFLDGMSIVLDMPQHGYWVGSITTSAPCKASVHKGLMALDEFWNKTGVKPLSMLCA